jgi:hypothetical protein
MGGLCGMGVAATTPNLIDRLLLVDVGPVIVGEGIRRIKSYVGMERTFKSFAEGEAVLRQIMVGFGKHNDQEFRIASRNYVIPNPVRTRVIHIFVLNKKNNHIIIRIVLVNGNFITILELPSRFKRCPKPTSISGHCLA